jgi:hypothetical protein
MKAMDLLAQDFATITFQNVIDFCDQKIVESAELDYKQAIPRDLTKHFSAMSNRYGGLIIVGVEEDPRTGLPARYEGIANDGKLIDRIHQFANNVRPLPTYHVRTTDEVYGKVFLLIRINEGGAPPYTSVNDPTVYLRTGNITTPLSPADAEIVRELYAKRADAKGARQDNVARAKAVVLSMLEQADWSRAQRLLHEQEPDGSLRFLLSDLDQNFRMLMAHLQPFYPRREIALPREINAAMKYVRVANQRDSARFFPSFDNTPMARGVLSFHWIGANDVSFSADQIYANGFFCHSERMGAAVRRDMADNIFLSDIARVLYTTLLFGRKLYGRLGYSGLTQGAMQLTGARRRPVSLIPFGRQHQVEYPLAIDAAYHWPIEADTHQLGDDDWMRSYFYRTMREIYWDLGIADVSEKIFDEFLALWRFT